MDPRRTFLVIEPFGVIAEDLAMSVSDFDAGADVRIGKSLDDAVALAEGADGIVMAVVNADPRTFAASELRALLAARNAAVVLIGDSAELANGHAGFPVMHRPYAPETVVAMLGALLAAHAQARSDELRA